MHMPAAREEHARLKALAGSWAGEEKLHPSPWDPEGGTATARVESRMDLDGFFLLTDYIEERGGQVSYRGHGVFGWDPQDGQYTMYWFDSIGSIPPGPARGRWEGNTLLFESAGPMGHSRYIYTLESDGRYTFRIEHSQDGRQWVPFMEGVYSRR